MKKLGQVIKENSKVAGLVKVARVNLNKCFIEINKDQHIVDEYIKAVGNNIEGVYKEHSQKIEDSICNGFESVYGVGGFNGTLHRLKGSIKSTYNYLVDNYSPVLDECFKIVKNLKIETKLTTAQCGQCFVLMFMEYVLNDTPVDVVQLEQNSETFDKDKLIEEAKSVTTVKDETSSKNEIVIIEQPAQPDSGTTILDQLKNCIGYDTESISKVILNCIPTDIINMLAKNNINASQFLSEFIDANIIKLDLETVSKISKIRNLNDVKELKLGEKVILPIIDFVKDFMSRHDIKYLEYEGITIPVDVLLKYLTSVTANDFDEDKIMSSDEYKKLQQILEQHDTTKMNHNVISIPKYNVNGDIVITRDKQDDMDPVNFAQIILSTKCSGQVDKAVRVLEKKFKELKCEDILQSILEGYNLSMDELAYILMVDVDNSLHRVRTYIVNSMIRDYINVSENKDKLRKELVNRFFPDKFKPTGNLPKGYEGFYKFYKACKLATV